TGRRERGGRRQQGGAGGKDVVHNHAVRRRRPRGPEGVGYIGGPLLGGQGGLRRCFPHPPQYVRHRNSGQPADRRGQPLALIVTSFPKSSRAEWYRDQRYPPRQWLERPHRERHGVRGAPPPIVLEMMHRAAGGVIEPDGTSYAPGGLRPASAGDAWCLP